ncbi:uncharacterized protein DEA37_0003502 [Paragonimus westermani]|uniref:Uncharacterized protein n=1 Tax=Paragonimus westermani TaxID=34504 RepID=A0A5J4NCU5_9TREM|nr:uncharacterized protein DEA37_0003502 [Paragonimus westermani]
MSLHKMEHVPTELDVLLLGLKNMSTEYNNGDWEVGKSQFDHTNCSDAQPSKLTPYMQNNGQLIEDGITTSSDNRARLPWREVETDCGFECDAKLRPRSSTDLGLDASLTAVIGDFETARSRSPWTAYLRMSDAQSPATDRQAKRLASIHSEAEFSMHHQEPDYAHHKHYLHQHHHHTPYSFINDDSQASSIFESPIHKDVVQCNPDDHAGLENESHFRDNYPHHHHHYHYPHHHHNHHHYHARTSPSRPLDPVRDEDDLMSPEGHQHYPFVLDTVHPEHSSINGKLTSSEYTFSNELNSQSEFHEALYRLRWRVMNWLDGVQEAVINVRDDSVGAELELR